MPVTPPIFLCYGRPDSTYATALGAELFRLGVESFNYQIRPVEDRLGSEVSYESYLFACGVFVAIITPEAVWREKVQEEIAKAINLRRSGVDRPIVYVTTPLILDEYPIPHVADCLVDMARVGGPDHAASAIVSFLGRNYIGQCQEKLSINCASFSSESALLESELRSRVFPTADLERGHTLLQRCLGPSRIELRVAADLARMRDPRSRSAFAHILADVVSFADSESAGAVSSKAEFRVTGKIGPKWDVSKKAYGDSERLALDSQVIRGLARIANALGNIDVAYASDVSQRIDWPQTRVLAQTGVYACAVNVGLLEVALKLQKVLAGWQSHDG